MVHRGRARRRLPNLTHPDRQGLRPPWHTVAAAAAAERLDTSLSAGLSPGQAERRLAADGPNAIPEARRRSVLRLFLGQFTDFMVLVLAAAAVLAGVVGEPQDTVAIAAILLLNALLGFVQEYRSERALHALRALAQPAARVRRDAVATTIPAAAIVRGDLVLLEAGNVVPADLRLVEAAELRVDEAALTGESGPVSKSTAALAGADLPVADRVNLAFKGTTVVSGRAAGVAVATGLDTELGRIAGLLSQEGGVATPLQRRLGRLGQILAVAALVICAVILALGLLRGEEPLRMVLTAVSLAVAAIPEALPAVVTVALSLGAKRMVRRQVLVRQLPAVETLGSVTHICADKTGTLTQHRMQVAEYRVDGEDRTSAPWSALLTAMALDNDAVPSPQGQPAGDPMEVALYHAAREAGRDPVELLERFPRIGELPFTAARARMTTLHRASGGVIAYTKGAPERLLPDCVARLTESGPGPLDRAAILAQAEDMASAGLRVLGFAIRELPGLPDPLLHDRVETGQTFVGLVGIIDPPRAGAREAVASCRSAGITVVMITGDHPLTARAIARELSIPAAEDQVMTGSELARLTPEALARRVEGIRVYARVAPEQKLAIVRALQANGECVAMTGDGVNDAPALRRADIGVAMGRTGTDVAREAAHLVLLDDNFESIVAAVRAGRRIYDNLRKFVRYVVSCNAAEIWTLMLAPLVGLPIPLLPIHLLWINLVTDGLPGLALAAEPAEADVMRRPPRAPGESFFARGLWQHVLWVGVLMAAVTLATQAWAWRNGSPHWQTMTFTVLALSQMGQLLAIRSERQSLFRLGFRSNPLLLAAVALTVLLQLGAIYWPPAAAILKTQPLTAGELLGCVGLSAIVLVGVEIEKWFSRRARPGA